MTLSKLYDKVLFMKFISNIYCGLGWKVCPHCGIPQSKLNRHLKKCGPKSVAEIDADVEPCNEEVGQQMIEEEKKEPIMINTGAISMNNQEAEEEESSEEWIEDPRDECGDNNPA